MEFAKAVNLGEKEKWEIGGVFKEPPGMEIFFFFFFFFFGGGGGVGV